MDTKKQEQEQGKTKIFSQTHVFSRTPRRKVVARAAALEELVRWHEAVTGAYARAELGATETEFRLLRYHTNVIWVSYHRRGAGFVLSTSTTPARIMTTDRQLIARKIYDALIPHIEKFRTPTASISASMLAKMFYLRQPNAKLLFVLLQNLIGGDKERRRLKQKLVFNRDVALRKLAETDVFVLL